MSKQQEVSQNVAVEPGLRLPLKGPLPPACGKARRSGGIRALGGRGGMTLRPLHPHVNRDPNHRTNRARSTIRGLRFA